MIRGLKSRHIFITLLALFIVSLLWISKTVPSSTSSTNKFSKFCSHIVNIADNTSKNSALQKISCIIDNGKTYQCYQDELINEIYFPFNTFLKKHFDVTGKLVKGSNLLAERFEWSTSHARVRFPDFTHYDHHDAFGHFASYSVETRDRVRCISAQNGVPMSTQWSPIPYFYPIQIAQYALQHYSRFKTDPSSVSLLKGVTFEEWNDNTPGQNGIKLNFDDKTNTERIVINADEYGVSLALDEDPAFVMLSFFWTTDLDGSFTVRVKLVQSGKSLLIHYVHGSDDRCVWYDEDKNKSDYYYSLGSKVNMDEWRWICRDLLVDTGRAIALTSNKKESILLHPGDVSIESVTFRGHSIIRDLKQRSSAHIENFLVAADWLVINQDVMGGWSVPVQRSMADKRLVLQAGWHSSMAQGHALSVLTRAYSVTNDSKYLQAAKRALRLFRVAAKEGGVVNELFGYPWFEEYPTSPGTFVLNGFLYSLIGLYDFSLLNITENDDNDSALLFSSGLESLRVFLPLFDSGSGTFYDLRHLGLQTAPNLARWDYHSVHIYLLKWLYIITKDELLNETANRWAAYATGHRAKHN